MAVVFRNPKVANVCVPIAARDGQKEANKEVHAQLSAGKIGQLFAATNLKEASQLGGRDRIYNFLHTLIRGRPSDLKIALQELYHLMHSQQAPAAGEGQHAGPKVPLTMKEVLGRFQNIADCIVFEGKKGQEELKDQFVRSVFVQKEDNPQGTDSNLSYTFFIQTPGSGHGLVRVCSLKMDNPQTYVEEQEYVGRFLQEGIAPRRAPVSEPPKTVEWLQWNALNFSLLHDAPRDSAQINEKTAALLKRAPAFNHAAGKQKIHAFLELVEPFATQFESIANGVNERSKKDTRGALFASLFDSKSEGETVHNKGYRVQPFAYKEREQVSMDTYKNFSDWEKIQFNQLHACYSVTKNMLQLRVNEAAMESIPMANDYQKLSCDKDLGYILMAALQEPDLLISHSIEKVKDVRTSLETEAMNLEGAEKEGLEQRIQALDVVLRDLQEAKENPQKARDLLPPSVGKISDFLRKAVS